MSCNVYYNVDDLIEYCPESPPPRIIHVCSLCLRQYDLEQDLRGHLMEFHGYRPISESTKSVKNAPTTKVKLSLPVEQQVRQMETEDNVSASALAELRPMPFKDFRIALRTNMKLNCTASASCAYKFENQSKLDLHVKCHKPKQQQTSNKLHFLCYECGLDLANWRRCSAHLWKVHTIDVDLLNCPYKSCDYKSPVSVLIWRHMRVHKRWRPRVLRSLRAVLRKRQLKAKTNAAAAAAQAPRPNKNKYYSEKTCEICSRTFVNGKTLSKHVKTVHNKIKPFICNVCGKKTARKASLIIHMRQHTGEKPLHCKICKFSTRDPSVLHKHKMTHEKQRKLSCAHCSYTCIQANAYKRHLRLNHPAEYRKISCDLCSFTTINADKLHAHKEDHRKGLITNCEDSMDASRAGCFKYPRKLNDKNNEISADCFMPLESIDSMPHEPAVDTGGVTIPAPSEDTQFPTYLNN